MKYRIAICDCYLETEVELELSAEELLVLPRVKKATDEARSKDTSVCAPWKEVSVAE